MKRLLLYPAILVMAAAPTLAQAIAFDFRSSTNTITFGTPGDLSTATDAYSIDIHVTGTAGESTPSSVSAQSNWTNWSFTAGSNLTTTGGAPPVSNQSPFTVGLITDAPSYYSPDPNVNSNSLVVGYDSAASTTPGQGFLLYDPIANTLHFSGGRVGLLAAGNTFDVFTYIQGDWINKISGLSVANGFSDPTIIYSGGQTIIHTTDTNYDGSTAVNMNFTLSLTTVPEPSTIALLSIGMIGLRVRSNRHPAG